MAKTVGKIGVIGAGVMGGAIAQVFALREYKVTLVDTQPVLLQLAIERLKKYSAPELHEGLKKRIQTTTNIEDVRGADFLIEAVSEKIEIKKDVFDKLSTILPEHSIIATNTSAISIDELSQFVFNPKRFIGMHFMNPPQVIKLIEIVKGKETTDETVRFTVDLAKRIDGIPAIVHDSPGFVSNRLLFSLLGEAIRTLEAGVANKEAIDAVIKEGLRHPMGPIELADFIGLDVCRDIMAYLHSRLKDDKFKPPALLEKLVKDGKLGRKTKKGFYKYE